MQPRQTTLFAFSPLLAPTSAHLLLNAAPSPDTDSTLAALQWGP